jgi:hypothetical protein
MGLGREIAREYVRHRLYGRRHHHRHGWRTVSSRYVGPFAARRPRSHHRTNVSGCGCCLPIPLGLLAGTGLGLNVLLRRRP